MYYFDNRWLLDDWTGLINQGLDMYWEVLVSSRLWTGVSLNGISRASVSLKFSSLIVDMTSFVLEADIAASFVLLADIAALFVLLPDIAAWIVLLADVVASFVLLADVAALIAVFADTT